MGSKLQIALAAIAAFFFVGSVLEFIFHDNFSNGERQAESPATAFIASQEAALPPSHLPSDSQPRPNQKGAESASRPKCTASELHTKGDPPFNATLKRVVDGDTIKVEANGTAITIRLWGIDAPEVAQPVGTEARTKLLQLMPIGSQTTVYPFEKDIYGRTVATVGPEDQWAHNMSMLAYGMAYHVNDYESKNNLCLSEAQRMAETWKVGVWQASEEGGIRPWNHRRKPPIPNRDISESN